VAVGGEAAVVVEDRASVEKDHGQADDRDGQPGIILYCCVWPK